MNVMHEEALYDFLDNVTGSFELDDVVSYIQKIETKRMNRLPEELEAFINMRKLAFPAGEKQWVSRRACFGPITFVINPTRLELLNGILIPGHRCIPFANSSLLPQEYTFYWQGCPVPFTTTEGPPEEFYPFYNIFGEEYAPQYVARDNAENEQAYNSDPYDDPPEVSIKTLDMRNIYRETSFVPGDRFTVRTLDWRTGDFELEKVSKDEWNNEDLLEWFNAAEAGFENSFSNIGPASCTEEQIAYAYWYGSSRMRSVPAYALEDFLYEKTNRIETAVFGIETRFWFTGREIPDLKELDTGNVRPDRTPVEEIFSRLKIPVSDYVIQSYIRDALFHENTDSADIIRKLIPDSIEMDNKDKKFLTGYIRNILTEFREIYTPFTDKAMGPIRQRAAELHTAVIDLAARLKKGDIDTFWLPRHTFIILSQIQNHTASVLEDLDSDESPPENELEALDSSLDSMIETYEDIKELIDEALDNFRRNKLAVIRAGSNSDTVKEKLVQISINSIDVWRRLIIPEQCTLGELHHIVQKSLGWRDLSDFRFSTGKGTERLPHENSTDNSDENILDQNTCIGALKEQNINELLYEYGTNWIVRIMILSNYESPGKKPVRCIAGAGVPPPEFIEGPVKFRKILSALEYGNDLERLGAQRELGSEFIPGDFDLDACNRSLNTILSINEFGDR